jgi:hypothetical protein
MPYSNENEVREISSAQKLNRDSSVNKIVDEKQLGPSVLKMKVGTAVPYS